MELVGKAFDFARAAQKGQKRKYTGAPYFDHPVEVAKIVKGVSHTEEMIAAALLHDVVEDTPVTLDEIKAAFGENVATLVDWLSDPEGLPGNRATRKAAIRERWKNAPNDAKTIKLADTISNSSTIFDHDPNFARVYGHEIELLLPCLEGGDPTLHKMASVQLAAKQMEAALRK
jgi:(p)ppGpp synthase/HD superfamily hydrolase